MERKLVGLVLIVAGVTAGLVWAAGGVTHPFAPVVALLLFLVGASMFGKTSQLAERLQPLVGRSVRVLVWGTELPGFQGSRSLSILCEPSARACISTCVRRTVRRHT